MDKEKEFFLTVRMIDEVTYSMKLVGMFPTKKEEGNLVVLCLVKISSRKVKVGVFINYL